MFDNLIHIVRTEQNSQVQQKHVQG